MKEQNPKDLKGTKGKCAIYVRVSTEEQDVQNQLEPLVNFSKSLQFKVVEIYEDKMSGAVTKRPRFQQMLKDARLRRFDTILVWSLDRFSRESTLNTLTYIEKLKKYKVNLRSLQESWMDIGDSGAGELILMVMSWVARRERERISERTKSKLDMYKRQLEEQGFFINKKGKKCYSLGRPKGSKDENPRNNLGYLKRWEK